MTRQDVCQQLTIVKNKAMVKLSSALPTILKLGGKKIEAVENGLTDFNVADMLLYLQMCGASMELVHWDYHNISTLADLREALTYERKESELTITALATLSHVSSSIISAFEDGRCGLKIDTLVKILNALDITLEIS